MPSDIVAKRPPISSDPLTCLWHETWTRERKHYITEYLKPWSMYGGRKALRSWALHYGRLVRMLERGK